MGDEKRVLGSKWLHGFIERNLAWTPILFVTLFFIGSPFTSFTICYLLYQSPLWPLLFVYLTWVFVFDWNTPKGKGRRWLSIRNSLFMRLGGRYFKTFDIVKTKDLNPKKNHIFVYHPHGLMCIGMFTAFSTESGDCTELFSNMTIYPTTMAYVLWMPFVRELFIALGMCLVSKESLLTICQQKRGGNIACVAVGGGEEAFEARPGNSTLNLKKRKGFVKVALQTGASLVPVYAFGENELFNQVEFSPGSFGKRIQDWIKKQTGLAPVLFYGRYFILPHRPDLTIVCGEPIDIPKSEHPSQEEVDKFHLIYIEKLTQLFDKHKGQYNVDPDAVLKIR